MSRRYGYASGAAQTPFKDDRLGIALERARASGVRKLLIQYGSGAATVFCRDFYNVPIVHCIIIFNNQRRITNGAGRASFTAGLGAFEIVLQAPGAPEQTISVELV